MSKATARHALEVLVKSGHARHVESKPHQVTWRQPGTTKTPDGAVGARRGKALHGQPVNSSP
jgi:hypothetical protein